MTTTNRSRLQTLLDGGVPDAPPHFELAFQLEKELLGIDRQAVAEAAYASDAARVAAILACDLEVNARLIEDFGYAAVAPRWYDGWLKEPDALRGIAMHKKALGSRALVYSFADHGVFWMPNGHNLMEFVVRMYERPDEMRAEARAKVEDQKRLARLQLEAGVDFIVHNTDFGYNNGPFISPDQFREFVTPYMTELVRYIHDLGLKVILHSDGDLRVILDQIHSTGVDGYQSVDPQGHMDIKAVREQYPDWLLMGNVNCAMLQDTDERAIGESVAYCMTHGGIGKRYIFSTSNCIFAGMPPESYRIMLRKYRDMIHRRVPCSHDDTAVV